MVKKFSRLKWILKHEGLFRHFWVGKKLKRLNSLADSMDKEEFLKKKYETIFGVEPNVTNPKTFNEKLLWEKLHWYNPICITCADKYEVRNFVTSRGCGKYLNELYFVGTSTSEIDLSILPERFIIKTTHDSGGLRVIRDKNNEKEVKKAFSFIESTLHKDYLKTNFEWVYNNHSPKVIVEKLIDTKDGHAPFDYKFFCFDGEPYILFVGSQRDFDLRFDFFDLKWNHLPVENLYLNNNKSIKIPENFSEMISLARTLSKGFPHVRIDLYDDNGKIVFGEMTFFHQAGNSKFYPNSFDKMLGEKLNLDSIPSSQIIDLDLKK
jgi:hypothetical protein